jgi:N-6 DNA Methylase/Eco57I restriction-modification methylase
VIPGIAGSLLSDDALERVVPEALRGRLDEVGRAAARRRLHTWHLPLRRVLGPVSAARSIFDRLASPLVSQLGYRLLPSGPALAGAHILRAMLEANGRPAAGLVVTNWGEDPATAWRDAVLHGIGEDVRWCLCLTGPLLRVVDSRRTYSRRFVEFDLEVVFDNEKSFAVFWGLLRAAAMSPRQAGIAPLLEQAVTLSEDHRASVRASLQIGVNEALVHLAGAFARAVDRRKRGALDASIRANSFNEALNVVYRVLFLLFAEARGLVPRWHPVYRDGYTIEALRQPVEHLPRPRGLWESLQAIARLAHRGCRLGELAVTPFNGRLFSPAEAPLAESAPLDDAAVRQALLALTTRTRAGARERISYGDLGVEQLGGVYERVLDLEPASLTRCSDAPTATRHGASPFVRTDRRKSTGSFYTPRTLTEYLVRRTLAPLVHYAAPESILSLRILDPAMGSGAFLVAACRYLATAYESALVRSGDLDPGAIAERDRAGFRRTIAQRCLYGVDVNPMAVQLGRLSLWLATLAADRPLTFLDHRLRVGNSLVGAGLADIARQPPGSTGRHRTRTVALPLFDDPARDRAVIDAIATRDAIAIEPGDTLSEVRAKERALARLANTPSALSRWKDVADVWCAAWFVEPGRQRRLPPFAGLADHLLERGGLPDHVAAPIVGDLRGVAARERFFHWTLEFPEVFHGGGGDPGERPGFDAIIGNPPWEMLRGDGGDESKRRSARAAASSLTDFVRRSGIYRLQGEGHLNLYQLFLERMISLVRAGGRLGVILPSGLASDHGAAPLRRALLDRTSIDTLISVENRDGVFPIHRGLKFLLVAAAVGEDTHVLPCRFGVRRPEDLDRLPDLGQDREAVMVPRRLLHRLGGDELAIPDIRRREDVDILSHVAVTVPALGESDGWNVRFGRELNATEDRAHFAPRGTQSLDRANGAMLPVIEGKLLTPFAVNVAGAAHHIEARTAATLLDSARTFKRDRLAYRDVASPTNRLTLIAAIVPAGAVTTHSVFCLKEPLDHTAQQYLCAIFNSFVANYLVRLRVSTHVTTTIVERLPVPKPARDVPEFVELAALSATLAGNPSEVGSYVRLQALAAALYGLNREQLRYVLETFPLVPLADREAVMAAFCDIVT